MLDSRLFIEACARSGDRAVIELRLRRDTVEVWHQGSNCAVLDRDVLRAWLVDPEHPYVVDDVAFSLDPGLDRRGRIAISVPGVLVWTLSDAEVTGLQKRV